MPREKRAPKTIEQWGEFAGRLRLANEEVISLYVSLRETATMAECKLLKDAAHKIQRARWKAHSLAAKQVGWIEADRLFESWHILA